MIILLYAIIFIFSLLSLKTIFHYYKHNRHHLPPTPFRIPIIGHLHLLGPLMHQSLHKLSSTYGPLIYLRLGSIQSVVVSNPEMAKEFLKTHDLTFSYRIFNQAIDYLTYNAATPLAPYSSEWIFVKKLSISELLGSHTLNKFLPLRTQELHSFLRMLVAKSETGESVNLSKEMLRLTNNIISRMIVSRRCSENNDEVVDLVREVTAIFGEFNISDFIWFFKNWDLQGIRRRLKDIRTRYDVLLEKIIREREEDRKKRLEDNDNNGVKDFLDLLLDVVEDKNSDIRLSRVHMKGLVMDYLTAGTDSTSVAIEWAMAEIINNPTILKKARQEIESKVGKQRLVEESDVPNLTYIQAIIKETFRLHPPIPLILRSSIQECKVKNYTIPNNTLLMVNLWSIGRDSEIWKNPLEFNPERFYENDFDFRGQHFQLLPFGSGRRNCSGMSLAMQILPITLATLIQCFDWTVVASRPAAVDGGDQVVDMTEKPGITAPLANHLVCVPIARFNPF
ncbi:cytochrome P450 93B2-like [Mercurialis annua]|uniref:cytochrome P450 93B2-like n=1 Tax=Mercurialis annua TaxID=3986 RepID=UPI00215E5BCC|nr:cytochrome P450 93B2-like [Mercurialis annua]